MYHYDKHIIYSTYELAIVTKAAGVVLKVFLKPSLIGKQKMDKSFVTKADKESGPAICATPYESYFPEP